MKGVKSGCALFPAHARRDPSRAVRGAHPPSPHGWDAGGHQARAVGIQGATAKTLLSLLCFGERFVDLFHCTFVFVGQMHLWNRNNFVRPGIWGFVRCLICSNTYVL